MTRQERLVQILFRLWSPFYDLPPAQALFYRPVHRALLAAVERRGDGAQPRAVLDLGCGTGQLTADLRARFPNARVVGLDLSQAMLRQADARAPLKVRGNVYALPFADGTFELVTSSISYHFYLEPARALAEVRRVLAPGGRFALATLAPPRPGLFRLMHGPHMRVVGARQVARDLADAGLRVTHEARARLVVGIFVAERP